MLELCNPLEFSPDNKGAKQSPAAQVLRVWMSVFGSCCCSRAETGCAVSLQRGRVTCMIIRLLSGLQHPLFSCPHSFLGHKEVSMKTNLTEIIYLLHYQMCLFVFWGQFAVYPNRNSPTSLQVLSTLSRDLCPGTTRPTSAVLRWRAPRPAAPALQPSSAWCSRSRPSLC